MLYAYLLNPCPFLQITGSFVVEDAVRNAAPEVLSGDSAALLWEAAAGSLRGVLERALDQALGAGAPAAVMLLLKVRYRQAALIHRNR